MFYEIGKIFIKRENKVKKNYEKHSHGNSNHRHTQVTQVHINLHCWILMALRCIKNSSFSVIGSLNLPRSLLARTCARHQWGVTRPGQYR